jgi:hypothetical protein
MTALSTDLLEFDGLPLGQGSAVCLPARQGRAGYAGRNARTLGFVVGPSKPMESEVSNVETVRAIYEAFGRGDVATILDKLDDAVEWLLVP